MEGITQNPGSGLEYQFRLQVSNKTGSTGNSTLFYGDATGGTSTDSTIYIDAVWHPSR